MKRVLIIFALLMPASLLAATASLSWTAPTQYTDGTTIGTAAITYRVYAGLQGAAKTVIATQSATSYSHTGALDGATWCYQVSAVVGGQESAKTTEACKSFPPLVPNPPSGLQVVQVVTGMNWSPVYKYTLANKRSPEPAGFIAVGKQCSGDVLFSYRGESYRQVAQVDVTYWQTVASDRVAAPCKSGA